MSLPELGPLLGSLVEPERPEDRERELGQVRLDLVGALFERAHAARRLMTAGDEMAARRTLGSRAWLELWDRAVEQSTAALTAKFERELRAAATYSKYPTRRLTRELPSADDRRILSAKLSAAGIGLEAAADGLESPALDWQEALRRIAGELEMAWQQLLTTARGELSGWERRAEVIRRWRRSWTPIFLGGTLALVLSVWLGLMLGGYLPVPGPLRPVAEWIWSLPWL